LLFTHLEKDHQTW